MQIIDRRRVFVTSAMLGVALLAVPSLLTAEAASAKKWVCPPCGCAADGKEFDAPGRCPDCAMELIEKPEDKPSPPATAAAATQPTTGDASKDAPSKDPKAAAPPPQPAKVQPPQ